MREIDCRGTICPQPVVATKQASDQSVYPGEIKTWQSDSIKWLAGPSRSRAPYNKDRDSAPEILRQGYAKREIDKEEFYQKKRDLV